ncbi:hypothetical protein JHK82_044726 [Glycine max]|nr:hypothetical protein JHK82_044726 [Glycine max]
MREKYVSSLTSGTRELFESDFNHQPHLNDCAYDDNVSKMMWINNFYHPNHAITNLSSFLRCFDLWVLTYQKVTTGSYSRCSSLYTSRTSSPSAMSSSM